MSRRRSHLGILAALLLVITTVFVAPTPALAAGGGCTYSTQGSWRATPCIGDDGVYAYPDFYIDAKPSGYNDCYSRAKWQSSSSGSWYYRSCNVGHYTIPSVQMQGALYWTVLEIWVQWYPGGSYVREFSDTSPACW
jgi:hypothetical protein